MSFAARAGFLLLILFYSVGYAANPEDGYCNGDEFAFEAVPDFEDYEPEDPFITLLRDLRRELQPVQLAFSDWFWAVEGDRKGGKGKYRLLLTLSSSMQFFERAQTTLERAREYGMHPDALHSIKNFIQLSYASLARMNDIFVTDLRLLERGLPEELKPQLEALRQQQLKDAAITQISPMMRQVLSGLNEALVVANRLINGEHAPSKVSEISTEQMLARLRILYALSKVPDPKQASAFLGDGDQTLEVVANFVSNAQQAGGQLAEISVEAKKAYRDFGDKPRDNDRYRCLYSAEQKSGHYVGFTVVDQAGGMEPA
ncbi:MAG: hypothetical protein KDD39_14400, partial [Bdellovibrionales bacterium]|nr:hypothetical protein [Bdellovibrionales bacterium]